MKIKRNLLGGAALFVMFAATSANAQQSQGMDVTATVPDACVIDNFATNLQMNFGSVDGTTGADETTDATLSWRCSAGTNATISIDGGESNDETAREMTGDNNGSTLSYNIYQDAALSTLWGTGGNANTSLSGNGLGAGDSITTTIYGVIRQVDAESAVPDDYDDLVTITIAP